MHSKRDVQALLDVKDLNVYFQPITDLGSLAVVGVEALLRPVSMGGELLSPGAVFDNAQRNGVLADLDEMARDASIRAFAADLAGRDILLFLNYSAETWADRPIDLQKLQRQVQEANLDPGQVAIEFVESHLPDHDALESLGTACRDAGFRISLDDFGTRHSNLERVVAVAPDVIKIDRSVIGAAGSDQTACTLLRSITYLARTMGSHSLAEGIESYEDLYTCSRLGISLAQGFLLGRPSAQRDAAIERSKSAAEEHRPKLRTDLERHIKDSQLLAERREDEIAAVVDHLAAIRDTDLEEALTEEIRSIGGAESGCVVDLQGIRITPVVSADPNVPPRALPGGGAGHSLVLKDYIYGLLVLGQRRFVSTGSLSIYSGQPCHTISTRFTTADKSELILCINLPSGGT